MRNSAVTIFVPWQRIRQYQMWEAQKKTHFPPKAASASFSDLITASYKTLIWNSKWSKIPFLSSLQLPQYTARNCFTAPTLSPTEGWEEVDGEDKQTLPPLLHSCPIQWSLQPLTDSILKSCSIIAFCLFKDLLGALQKSKAGHVLCAPAPKPYRENRSRKGQQQWGLNALLCFEPGFSLSHVPGKKAALP